jgi:hypothetical protein
VKSGFEAITTGIALGSIFLVHQFIAVYQHLFLFSQGGEWQVFKSGTGVFQGLFVTERFKGKQRDIIGGAYIGLSAFAGGQAMRRVVDGGIHAKLGSFLVHQFDKSIDGACDMDG